MNAPFDSDAILEDLTFLDGTGVGADEAARRTGFANASAMEKWLTKKGHTDLWKRLRGRDPAGTHDSQARKRRRYAHLRDQEAC